MQSDATKTCSRCRETKPLSEFYLLARRNRTEATNHRSHCKLCHHTSMRDGIRQWRTRNIERERASNRARYGVIRDYLRDIKHTQGCLFCAEREPAVLDFHHRDPSTKLMALGGGVHNPSAWPAVLAEIPKCVVLCANCHRRVHAGLLTLTPSK